MAIDTRTAPRQRATEALEGVSRQYGLQSDFERLKAAGDGWHDLAVAMLAEAVEVLLLDLPVRPGGVKRKRRG